MTQEDQHKNIVRQFYASSKDGLAAALKAHEMYFSRDEVLHSPGEPPMDWEGHHQLDHTIYHAFEDFAIEILDIMADGDKVIARYRMTGTHTGEYFGVPATGRSLDSTGIAIYRFKEGKIVEEWQEHDKMTLLQQLGVMPAG